MLNHFLNLNFSVASLKKCKKGFTLIELVLVVTLMVITVGIAGDIIISLIRSYTKTQVVNEIEQNANFIMLKIDKELKPALNATVATNKEEIRFTIIDPNNVKQCISYRVLPISGVGTMQRAQATGACASNTNFSYANVSNNDTKKGISVSCSSSGCFSKLAGSSVEVVEVDLNFANSSGVDTVSTNTISLKNTIVLRGTY